MVAYGKLNFAVEVSLGLTPKLILSRAEHKLNISFMRYNFITRSISDQIKEYEWSYIILI